MVLMILMMAGNQVFGQEEKKDRRKTPPKPEQILKELDKDEDGKISRAEAKGPLKKHFAKIDADEDGYVSLEELNKAPKPKRREDRPRDK